MDPTIVKLAVGDMRLDVVPELGGTVLSWTRGGADVFRPALPGALAGRSARGLAAYPLVPYSNRIAKGRFVWRGVAHEIPASFGGNAIHGVGWTEPWACRVDGAASAHLTLDHAADAFWPFAFHASLAYALDDDSLTVTMRVENRHPEPAPVGIGLHPFFPRDADATLSFDAASVWRNGPDMIPEARIPIPAEWDHHLARAVGSAALDNCFAGWHGPVRLAFSARGHTVTMTADPLFAHLIVYVPLNFDFFAVEPVSNMNDAINRMDVPDHGLRVLASGESLEGRMRFDVASAPR